MAKTIEHLTVGGVGQHDDVELGVQATGPYHAVVEPRVGKLELLEHPARPAFVDVAAPSVVDADPRRPQSLCAGQPAADADSSEVERSSDRLGHGGAVSLGFDDEGASGPADAWQIQRRRESRHLRAPVEEAIHGDERIVGPRIEDEPPSRPRRSPPGDRRGAHVLDGRGNRLRHPIDCDAHLERERPAGDVVRSL